MQKEELKHLISFIVEAKRNTYVGSGESQESSSRPGSNDLHYEREPYAYIDSYFGGRDIIGQEEVVYYKGEAVWALNYYGRVLNKSRISGAQAGKVIKESLTRMYAQGRFLGGFEHACGEFVYHDSSEGEADSFCGYEYITHADE